MYVVVQINFSFFLLLLLQAVKGLRRYFSPRVYTEWHNTGACQTDRQTDGWMHSWTALYALNCACQILH